MTNKCNQCGVCCELFYINLNKEEYSSGKFETIFKDFKQFDKFSDIRKYGANILAKKADGGCVYLKNNLCGIHDRRPQVCHNFFCSSKNKKVHSIVSQIKKVKLRSELHIIRG